LTVLTAGVHKTEQAQRRKPQTVGKAMYARLDQMSESHLASLTDAYEAFISFLRQLC